MSNYLQTIDLQLSEETPLGKARRRVLSIVPWSPLPTQNVSYFAANRVLVISDQVQGEQIASRIGERMACFIAIPSDHFALSPGGGICYFHRLSIDGYLGRFSASIAEQEDAANHADHDANNLGKRFGIENGLFDHVIDCAIEPYIQASIKPPGYYHVGGSEDLLDAALSQIPELIGEFGKPRFFEFDPGKCAHGRSGVAGCRRCLDVCPADAIVSIGETIEVNPHLCQGGGACTSSCPSAALTYRYPKVQDQLEFLRQVIKELLLSSGNRGLTLLIYDQEHGAEMVKEGASGLPESVLPLLVGEVGSVGLDLLACAMAYGANRVRLLVPPAVDHEVRCCIERDVRFLRLIFSQLGLAHYRIAVIESLVDQDFGQEDLPLDTVAGFAAVGDKRSTIRSALTHFNQIATTPRMTVSLPKNSIFGKVDINSEACTLCMGCVSVCPVGALEAGDNQPALKLIEDNCLQCGLCTRACPESALSLSPQYNFDAEAAKKRKILKEEEPFRCLSCGKPFATHSMITKMMEKLKDHWMFQTDDALNRLKMCEDCRVADMFDKKNRV